MRARWILNLFLLLLVAGLAWSVAGDLRQARDSSRLTGMDPTRIEGVELTRPGRDTVRLERITGGGWRLTAPFKVPADPERVARLLEVVQAGVVRSFPAEGADLERLGLAPDPVRISLGGQTLRFGTTEPIDRLRYVASGDLVHLTQDIYYHLVTAPASDYVEPHPLPPGLTPTAADLDGTPLDPATLAAVASLKAERVEAMGGDLDGRILRVQPPGDAAPLRLLVSADGLRWSRPDLRLTYLVASPPPALVDPEGAGAAAASTAATAPQPGSLPEQAVGMVGTVQPETPPPAEPAPLVDEELDAQSQPQPQPGWGEAVVEPGAPAEMRVERLAPDSVPDEELDPMDARQREIEDAVAPSFGGPPVRSNAQIQREQAGSTDEDAIVSPDAAKGPPPAVKLRP